MEASRTVLVDGVALRIEVDRSAPEAIADHLHVVLAGYPDTDEPPAATLQVRGGHGDASVVSAGPGAQELHFERWPDVVAHIDGWLSASSLDHSDPRALHLHAAHFELDQRRWIVVGAKGSGKSTLAFAAAVAGAKCCTDERITLVETDDGVDVRPLRRPLHIRSDAASVEQQLRSIGDRDLVESAARTIVAQDPPGTGPTAATAGRPAQLIVLDDSGVVAPPLPRTAITRLVVSHSMDAQRCGHRTLELLHWLVRTSDVHVVPPRSLRSVDELDAASLPADPSATSLTRARPRVTGDGTWSLRDGDRVLAWVESDEGPWLLELGGVAAERWMEAMEDRTRAHESASDVIRSIQTSVGQQLAGRNRERPADRGESA